MADTTKQRILTSALKNFATYGFHGCTTRTIAEDAEVEVSAIHYHFKNKDTLYSKIIEDFGLENSKIATAVLKEVKSADDFVLKLELFLEQLHQHFHDKKEAFLISSREIEMPVLETTAAQAGFDVTTETLRKFLQEAQKKKIIKKDLDLEFLCQSIWAQLVHELRFEKLMKRRLPNSQQWLKKTINLLLNGMRA